MLYLHGRHWLSRDIIFLGYDGNLQYGTAVRHFLREYYFGEDPTFVRAGLIRQGVAIDIKEDGFNTYAVQLRKVEGSSW